MGHVVCWIRILTWVPLQRGPGGILCQKTPTDIPSRVGICVVLCQETHTQTPSLASCAHTMWYSHSYGETSPRLSKHLAGDYYISAHRSLCLHLSWGTCLHSISSALLAMWPGLLTVVWWNLRSYSKRKKYSIMYGPTCCFYEPRALLPNRLHVGSTWLTW